MSTPLGVLSENDLPGNALFCVPRLAAHLLRKQAEAVQGKGQQPVLQDPGAAELQRCLPESSLLSLHLSFRVPNTSNLPWSVNIGKNDFEQVNDWSSHFLIAGISGIRHQACIPFPFLFSVCPARMESRPWGMQVAAVQAPLLG